MSSADGVDSDTASSASGTSGDAFIEEDSTFVIEPDTSFDDAIQSLDELKLEPDSHLPELTSEETEARGAENTGSTTSSEDSEDTAPKDSGNKSENTTKTNVGSEKPVAKSAKKASMFDRLKRLTKFEKTPKSSKKSNLSKFRGVKIDRLPQCFVAKYLGKKEVKGLFGLQHVRAPVDEFVSKLKDDIQCMDKVELPLVYMVFSSRGIDIRQHPANKVHGELELCLHPIDFISYGVQDMKYWRVFTFIVVNELSVRQKKMECHVFIADSTHSARRMALTLSACFSVYKRKLNAEGKFHNFQVELRPPDELAGQIETEDFEA